MNKKDRALYVLETLEARYPEPETMLTWSTPWQLAVATMLAAQCTDERVNKVTPEFFRRWPGPGELVDADIADIEDVVRSTGFFRNKAKNLHGAALRVVQEYGGEMPKSLKELTTLPGIARKTANIVLSNAFGIHEGIAVDTHVKRITGRLGLTESTNPVIIERDLMPLFPQESWSDINHYLVFFGREVCAARKPRCSACELAEACPKIGVTTHA